jgi:Na+/pantothenate symporter
LVVSLLIGIFFGYRNRSKHSTKEVLLAGGKMHFIPVAMSLLASFMSAITLQGTPAEMYNFSINTKSTTDQISLPFNALINITIGIKSLITFVCYLR